MRSGAADMMEKLCERAASAHAERIAFIAEVADSGEWRADGVPDFVAWVARLGKESMRTARGWIHEAEALKHRPALQQALLDGEISVGQSKLLTILSQGGTDDDARWLECLPFWSYPELEHEARKHRARELERTDGGTWLRMSHTPDERFMRGEFQLHPEDGAAVMAAIDARIPKGTRYRELDHAAAEALVALAKGSAPVHVQKSIVLFAADDDVAELQTGGFVPAKTALRLMCSGRVQQVVVDADGKIVATAPNTQAVPASVERAVHARDANRCTFPGCDAQRGLEIHHLLWRINGGSHTLANLQLTCLRHHKYVHEGGWSLGTDAGHANAWYQPDGTRYEPFDTS